MKILPIILILAVVSPCSGYYLSNGYCLLNAQDGWFNTLCLDPSGQGKYGPNLIKSLSIGVLPDAPKDLKVEQTDNSLTFRNLPVRVPFEIEKDHSGLPVRLSAGGTLGVKFTVADGKITSVGGKFPTWHTLDSGCTLTLYLLPDGDMARKEQVASEKLANVPDNSVKILTFKPQPAGVYYLEMSELIGETIGWWGTNKDADPGMTTYVDGKEHADIDLALTYSGYNNFVGDWTVTLNGSNMKTEFISAQKGTPIPGSVDTRIVTAWEKSGYDLSMFPFTRFYTDSGQHMLPHEMKRRPAWGHLRPSKWVYAMGKKNADVRFNLPPGQHLVWEMADGSITWKFNGMTLDMDALPHTEKLPDYFPVFYSSDSKFDKVLNEFYYSHALNFGVGTPPDWKEWQALILDWTANPMRDEQKGHFTGVSMRPDGYVYTWGGQEGWPFPFKDEDKDGKNDFDTRHFTTNPCFILGAYRYFAWTRDKEFLREIMPKVRKAMAFDLEQCHGKDGIVVIDAKGHEGKADGIGSNYWDILPFGYKDAFCNSYYYAALEAMADLEEYCRNTKLDLPGDKRSPEYYKALRAKVRKSYNQNFWDDAVGRYVGCVDVDGVKHDYGFTFVNLEAMAYGLADKEQVGRIYKWMETEPTSSGKADTYSRWILAPRALTIHNPPRDEPQEPVPSWWHSGWGGTAYDEQCQDGGAILYTSGYDIMSRAKYLGADNAFKRMKEILDRYNKPDRLMGGNLLYYGETSQGGGNGAGSVGVEGEFPESGLAPASFLYAFLGINADAHGLKIRPNLPSSLKYAGVRNLCYAGIKYDIKVTNDSVEITTLGVGNPKTVKKALKPGEVFILQPGVVKK